MRLSKIECIIKPFKLEEVKMALTNYGISGLTAYEVKGYGRHGAHQEIHRGSEFLKDFTPRMKVELFVPTDQVNETVEAICQAARTGSHGDGKIFVSSLASLTRIRTGEVDIDAL